jgi:hypothetical protein
MIALLQRLLTAPHLTGDPTPPDVPLNLWEQARLDECEQALR